MIEYTDQQFLYRAVPVDYDGAAKLKRIKGNTLAFNQLLPTNLASSGSGNGVTFTNNGDGSYTFNGTSTGVTFIPRSVVVSAKANHKYLVNVGNDSNTGLSITINGLGEEYYVKTKGIISSPTDNNFVLFYQSGASFNNLKVWPQVIDLTAMFGSGKEPSTVDEFTSLFPQRFYPYQSTLLPFKGTSIKTVGKNLLKPYPYETTANGITIKYADDSCAITGTCTSNFAVPITSEVSAYKTTLLSGTYHIYVSSNKVDYQVIDLGASQIIATGITFTLNQQTEIVFRLAFKNGTTYDDTIYYQITKEQDNVFEPYTSSTTNLPTLTYFPNGMKSAGNVYDELLPTKAITRVCMVNLGSLDWALNGTRMSGLLESTSISGWSYNLICPKYTASTDIQPTNPTVSGVMGRYGNRILIYDSNYTTAEAFKTAMNGVYLYYELATPTETEVNEEIFYRFYQDGTEQILPINGATPTTAPIIADIEYYNQIEGETPYRKFWLVNGNGERWDLTEKELKSFLENPQGLGFQKTIDVTRYGERAYKNTESYNFPQVTGDVLFYDSANSTRYEKYNEFVRFLMEQPITLHYMIPVSYNSLIADTYSLECEVMSLTKTESKTDRILTSNIQMNGLGFYEGDEIEINGTANTLTINNKGDFPVGFEIELRGTYKNPYFTLEQNGELYGEAKFDDNANNFSSVFVNSKDGEQNVVLKQNNSIMPNPLAYQDLSISNGSIYVTFVKLAKGESTLTIGGDSYTISGYTIRYTPIYRSV